MGSGRARGWGWCLRVPRVSSRLSFLLFCSDVREEALPGKSQRQPQVRLKIALQCRGGRGGRRGQGSSCTVTTLPGGLDPPCQCSASSREENPGGERNLVPLGFCSPSCAAGGSSRLGEGNRIKGTSPWRKGAHSRAKSPFPHSHSSRGIPEMAKAPIPQCLARLEALGINEVAIQAGKGATTLVWLGSCEGLCFLELGIRWRKHHCASAGCLGRVWAKE